MTRPRHLFGARRSLDPGRSVTAGETGGAKVWILAFVAAAGAGFAGLVGIGCAIGANACPFTDQKPVTTTDGRALWTANCALCHGEDGTGTSRNARAPSLVSGPVAAYSQAMLQAKIERGSPGLMPRFEGKLSTAQIEAVARYVIALREER
jgi:cytochrome c oxidase cbb3-type subunit 3